MLHADRSTVKQKKRDEIKVLLGHTDWMDMGVEKIKPWNSASDEPRPTLLQIKLI